VLGISAFLLAVTILPVLGFGAAGPIAGSIAAGWQSSIGVVSASSLFAFFQSAGMGGAALTGITGIGIGGAPLFSMASLTVFLGSGRTGFQTAGASAVIALQEMGEKIKGAGRDVWTLRWRR